MAKKDEHIDYSNLPSDLVTEREKYDPRPQPGDDGKEVERLFSKDKPGTAADMDEHHRMFTDACKKDFKVHAEVDDELEKLEGFLVSRATHVRSKPAAEMIRELQDWIDARRAAQ